MLATLLVTVVGCTEPPTVAVDSLPLVGRWVWLQSSGGISGRVDTPQSTGTNRTLVVTSDSVLQLLQQDTVVVAGRFRIHREPTSFRSDTAEVLRLDGVAIWIIEFRSRDILALTDLCYDCFMHVWARQR